MIPPYHSRNRVRIDLALDQPQHVHEPSHVPSVAIRFRAAPSGLSRLAPGSRRTIYRPCHRLPAGRVRRQHDCVEKPRLDHRELVPGASCPAPPMLRKVRSCPPPHGDDQLIPQGVGHVIPHPGPLLLMIWSLLLMIWLAPPVVNGWPWAAWPPGRELAYRGGRELPDRLAFRVGCGCRSGADRGAGRAPGGAGLGLPAVSCPRGRRGLRGQGRPAGRRAERYAEQP
jgi:hypothetical protein